MIHFHGNYGNLTHHFFYSAWLSRIGYRTVIVDYSGFGNSGGNPGIENALKNVADVCTFFQRNNRRNSGFILFGQSIGAFLLLKHLFKINMPEFPILGVILESPCDDLFRLSHQRLSGYGLPQRIIRELQKRFLAIETHTVEYNLSSLPFSFYCFWSNEDDLIPADVSADVFHALPEPKKAFVIPGMRHLDIFSAKQGNARKILTRLISSLKNDKN